MTQKENKPWVKLKEEAYEVGPKPIGARRMTAYALASLGLDVVARKTVRALLPTGVVRSSTWTMFAKGHTGGTNRMSEDFKGALRLFEVSGWIQRGDKYILILDRRSLFNYAVDELDRMPPRLLKLERAVQAVKQQLADQTLTPKAIEQAHRELSALRKLMAPAVHGANWSGKGSVRRSGTAGSGE